MLRDKILDTIRSAVMGLVAGSALETSRHYFIQIKCSTVLCFDNGGMIGNGKCPSMGQTRSLVRRTHTQSNGMILSSNGLMISTRSNAMMSTVQRHKWMTSSRTRGALKVNTKGE